MNREVFAPSGTALASADLDGKVLLWDLSAANPRSIALSPPPAHGSALAFSPDGATLAIGGSDGKIGFYDAATGRSTGQTLAGTVRPYVMTYNAAGTLLAVGGSGGAIDLWDLTATSAEPPTPRRLTGQGVAILDLAFAADGVTLATAGYDTANNFVYGAMANGAVVVWDTARRSRLGTRLGPGLAKEPKAVAYGPGAGSLAALGPDDRLMIWPLKGTRRGASPVVVQLAPGAGVAVSPDGATIAVAGFVAPATTKTAASAPADAVTLLDAATGSPRGEPVAAGLGRIGALAYAPDGATLLIGGEKGVLLWDLARNAPRGDRFPVSGVPNYLALTPDGATLAVRDAAGVTVWNVAARTPRGATIRDAGKATYLALTPDGATIVAASYDGAALWDVASATIRATFPVKTIQEIDAIRLGPDGRTVAVGGSSGAVNLWDVATGSIRQGDSLGSPIFDIVYLPGGATLAVAVGAPAIDPVDAATIGFLGTVASDPSASIGRFVADPARTWFTLAASQDGRALAAVDGANVVTSFDLDPGTWSAIACAIANRNLTPPEWARYLGNAPYVATCPGLPVPAAATPTAATPAP